MIYFLLCRQPLNNRCFIVQWIKKLRRPNETYAISVVSYTYCINRVPEKDLRSKDFLGKGATVCKVLPFMKTADKRTSCDVVSYTFAKSQNLYSRRTNLFTSFAIQTNSKNRTFHPSKKRTNETKLIKEITLVSIVQGRIKTIIRYVHKENILTLSKIEFRS